MPPTLKQVRDSAGRLSDELQRIVDAPKTPETTKRRLRATIAREREIWKAYQVEVPTEQLIEMRAAGKTWAQIASEVGMSRQAVHKRVTKATGGTA